MSQQYLTQNNTKNVTPQCKILLYPWTAGLADPEIADSSLNGSHRIDISSQVKSCSVSKSMGQAAGTFSFTLSNSPGIGTQDWKDIIRRGTWCVIYMSNDGGLNLAPNVTYQTPPPNGLEGNYLRCIGYIKRVSAKVQTTGTRASDIEFEVSGKDFGVIYDETTLYHSQFQYEDIILKSLGQNALNITGLATLDSILDTVHDLMFYPKHLKGAKLNDKNSLLKQGLQWLLPTKMLQDIGMTSPEGSFWGSLTNIKHFAKTVCALAVSSPVAFLSGNAWEQLKAISASQFHELFCETDSNGRPSLTFRPIPWAIDKSGYPKAGQYIKAYKDLPVEVVPGIDVIGFDVGEDDNARYNFYLVNISSELHSAENGISFLQDSNFPFQNDASVRRNGFRPMIVTVNTLLANGDLANGTANKEQLIEFNEVMYDYWNNAVFAESGSINKIGSNGVKIGKCLTFTPDVPYLATKRYYIEGYSDNYSVGDKGESMWSQTVSVTRGFDEEALKGNQGFATRNQALKNVGEFTSRGSLGTIQTPASNTGGSGTSGDGVA
jgi:hypothetical protein